MTYTNKNTGSKIIQPVSEETSSIVKPVLRAFEELIIYRQPEGERTY